MFSNQDIIYFTIVFIVWMLSIPATFKAVKRKKRSSLWVFLTFLFLPLFFIVELLPDKSNKTIKMIACKACKQEISSLSKTCPHCGHPNNFKENKISLYEWIMGALILIILPIGFLLKSPMKGTPACDTSSAQNAVKETFETIPLMKLMSVSIIKINNIETINDLPLEKTCKATVILSNAQENQIEYKFIRKEDIIYTNVRIIN